jgi:hypothetical protein
MTDIQIPCVVENGYNTCYIDSLLVSLFYKNNDSLLNIWLKIFEKGLPYISNIKSIHLLPL